MSAQTLISTGFAALTAVTVASAALKGLYDVASGMIHEWRGLHIPGRHVGAYDRIPIDNANDIEARLRKVSENLKILQEDVDKLIIEREHLKTAADHE